MHVLIYSLTTTYKLIKHEPLLFEKSVLIVFLHLTKMISQLSAYTVDRLTE